MKLNLYNLNSNAFVNFLFEQAYNHVVQASIALQTCLKNGVPFTTKLKRLR